MFNFWQMRVPFESSFLIYYYYASIAKNFFHLILQVCKMSHPSQVIFSPNCKPFVIFNFTYIIQASWIIIYTHSCYIAKPQESSYIDMSCECCSLRWHAEWSIFWSQGWLGASSFTRSRRMFLSPANRNMH